MHTKDLENYTKTARSDISIQRIMYAYALLALNDIDKARAHLELFNKACASSIWSGSVLNERELVAFIDNVADKRGISS